MSSSPVKTIRIKTRAKTGITRRIRKLIPRIACSRFREFRGGGATFDQLESALLQEGYAVACSEAIVVHKRMHMQQCYTQDNFADSSESQINRNELQAHCSELEHLLDWFEEDCCAPDLLNGLGVVEVRAICRNLIIWMPLSMGRVLLFS